jgi:putative hemolysin
MLTAFGVGEVPISVSGDPAEPGRLVHTIRAVGPVSAALAHLGPGDSVGIRGPFGVGWPMEVAAGRDVIIVAGGLGLGDEPPEKVTDEDLRALAAEAERHGTIETAERRMIAGVLRLGDRPVKGVMTPRGEVDWIDAAAGEDGIREVLMRTAHSRLPVGDGSPEAMIRCRAVARAAGGAATERAARCAGAGAGCAGRAGHTAQGGGADGPRA